MSKAESGRELERGGFGGLVEFVLEEAAQTPGIVLSSIKHQLFSHG